MIDIVTVGAGGGSVAWLSPEGTLKVGPRSAGADPGPLCYGTRRHRADGHRRAPGARPDPAAPARRRDPARRRRCHGGLGRSGRAARPRRSSECAAGILEISAWNQANALRQITVKRGLDVRDFALVTFGGSGSLLAVPAHRHPRTARRAGAAQPGQPVGVRAAHRRRPQRLRADGRAPGTRGSTIAQLGRSSFDALTGAGRRRAGARGLRRADRQSRAHRRPALLRPGLRGAGDVPDGDVHAELRRRPSPALPRCARALYGYDFRGRRPSSRSSGSTSGSPGSARSAGRTLREIAAGRRRRTGAHREPAGVLRRLGRRADIYRPGQAAAPATSSPGPAVIEEFGVHRAVHPGFTRDVDRFGNLVVLHRAGVVSAYRLTDRRRGPIRSVLSRSSRATSPRSRGRSRPRSAGPPRSPMIRDAHDFRAGIHDRQLRKLTGRSYSALVHPVVRDYPLETMRPGDVFFHNDVYLSEGGIGHLPDLCVTVPVFHDGRGGRVRAGLRPPRRHRRRRTGLDAARTRRACSRRA